VEIERIVQEWYRLASGGNIEREDAFFRFIAVWVAFNAVYTSYYTSKRPRLPGDKKQVMFFSESSDKARERHRKLISTDKHYQEAVGYLKARGVSDASGRFEPQEINDETNLKEVLLCVYQVRCNLFHGGKMPSNARDSGLADAGYVVISKLVQPYLAQQNGRAEDPDRTPGAHRKAPRSSSDHRGRHE
jgi:hypothetical protein